MNQSDIDTIKEKLGNILPNFYIETMLNYPYRKDSFGEEFMLTNSVEILLDCNSVFGQDEILCGGL